MQVFHDFQISKSCSMFFTTLIRETRETVVSIRNDGVTMHYCKKSRFQPVFGQDTYPPQS